MPDAPLDPPILLRADADGVATLTLNRPRRRNALSLALIEALLAELAAIAADPAIRVVLLTAAPTSDAPDGGVFCSGHDLAELRADADPARIGRIFERCSDLMRAIVALPQPVIARVRGLATAAGCQLVASCDLALAADTARFATPGVNIGLFCSTPMVALSRDVPRKAALEMLLLGEAIDAATALRFGLINRAAPDAELDDLASAWAATIAGKSAATLRLGKAAFHRQLGRDLAEAYDFAAATMTRNMADADAQEGIDAFLAKRRPVWRDA